MSLSPNPSVHRRNKKAMFEGAHDFVVEDSVFVVNGDTSKQVDIGRLIDMVAPNSILNAGGRADEVRCFPGTREEVIGKLEKWMSDVREGLCNNRMMWLSGPAGAGKSAICQTVAERCRTRRQSAANFFFFRGDHTRNRAQPLVPTLVYQLRRLYPMLDKLLTTCLTVDPLICEASIEDQFLHLISSPIQALQQSSSVHKTIVLIIDGLDECNDSRKQEKILRALHALVNARHSPFLVLIASRAEPHLVTSFNRLENSVVSIFLDEQYRPQDDIRRFVTAKFNEIQRVHHLRQMLSKNWPTRSDIEAITNKSSGQFIYAATVMRFIEHSSNSPDLSLVMILEMLPSKGHHPLAQLDALYSCIFSRIRNLHAVKLILCANSVFNSDTTGTSDRFQYEDFLQLLGYRPVEIKSLFADLGAIIQVKTRPIRLAFYHASLHDYFKDKTRSSDYHLDMAKIAAEVAAIFFSNLHHPYFFDLGTLALGGVKEPTSELSESLLDASARTFRAPFHDQWKYNWHQFLHQIERLYFVENKAIFKKILRGWVCSSYRNDIDRGISDSTDMRHLSARIRYRLYCKIEGLKFGHR